MPLDTIATLSEENCIMIMPSMHGGRTDARCLLREWTEEEIN